MEKVLGLVAGLMMTAFTFGQSTITFTDVTDSYDKKATTSFNFIFSAAHTAEDIKWIAEAYYERYFTVTVIDAGDSGNTVKIRLVEDNEMARLAIMRLLINLDIKSVGVNGTDVERNEFMTTYIVVD